jgi:hypothetical protein
MRNATSAAAANGQVNVQMDFFPITFCQTPEGYISKDIYIPDPIQKSGKRIFPFPFFEWDMLKDIIS